MKFRNLNRMELALAVALPTDKRWQFLERFLDSNQPPITYEPVRRAIEAIIDIPFGFLEPAERMSWAEIKRGLRAVCTYEPQRRCNLRVAEGLRTYGMDHITGGHQRHFHPLSFGGVHVQYWANLVAVVDGEPTVFFVDPRRTHSLHEDARHVVFSMQHEAIRRVFPEYANIALAVLHCGGNQATPYLYDERRPLYSAGELQTLVSGIQSMWFQMQRERHESATGT